MRYVTVGLLYYRYLNYKAAGQTNKADSLKTKINQLAPGFLNDSTQTPTGS